MISTKLYIWNLESGWLLKDNQTLAKAQSSVNYQQQQTTNNQQSSRETGQEMSRVHALAGSGSPYQSSGR